jgi:threonine synthase
MEENTLADSIAVGVPRNFLKAVRAIKESKGITVNVSDQEILDAMALLGKTQGVFGEPAGVAGTAGLIQALAAKRIPAGATVVSIVTGNGLKDIAAAINAAGQPLLLPPDMERLAGELQRAGWLP